MNISVNFKKSVTFLLLLLGYYCNSQDSLYLSEPFSYSEWNGSVSAYSTASLDDNKFIVAYSEGGVWEGRVKLGTINESCEVSFGDHTTFYNSQPINGVEIKSISSSEFFVAYRSNFGFRLRVGKIGANDQIVFGAPFLLDNNYVSIFSTAAIESNKFLIAYSDPDTERGKCSLFSFSSDLTITQESSTFFTSSDIDDSRYISLDMLSPSRFLIAYGRKDGNTVIGNISNNEIGSISNPYLFDSNSAFWIHANSLNESTFIVTYAKGDALPFIGTSIIATVSNNGAISYSDNYTFSHTGISNIQTSKLTDNEIIISCANDSEGTHEYKGVVLKGTYSNNELQFSPTSIVTNDYNSNAQFPLTRLSDSLFAVQYIDAISFNGYAKVGGTSELESCISTSSQDVNAIDFSIHPNPVSSEVYIQPIGNIGYNLNIFDLSGKSILSQVSNQGPSSLDLSNLQNGIYILQFATKRQSVSRKLVVKK